MSNIGRLLYGYCEGYFGRESYQDKRIEAEGYDWIVVRDDLGRVDFAWFDDGEEKITSINKWSEEREEE